MKAFLRLFLLMLLTSPAFGQQVPDFTMTDVNGNSHSLYADYLDQGKTVLISVAATWNPWDSVWVDSGVLDEFHATYGDDAVVLFIEGDPNTPESDLYGTGNSTDYDFVTGHDYAVIDDSLGLMINEWGLTYYPFTFIVCSDGSGFTQDPGTDDFTAAPGVFYGDFEMASDIADKMYELCGTGFDRSKLHGLVYTDLSPDCDQSGENVLPMMIAEIDGPNGSFYRITDNNGEFRALADEGTYTVNVNAPNDLWTVCDNPQSYTFLNNQDSVYMDFGLQSLMPCTDPVVEISSPFLVRCFENNIYVHYCNEGTIPVDDVTVTVTLDSFLIVDGISQTPSSQNGFTYTFDIGTLGVFECGDIVFSVTVDCEAELGTEQCYSAQIAPISGCDNPLLPTTEECQDIVGSYDPNDKRAYPFQEGDDYAIGPNEIIKYMIRFQNTGTFMAFKVEVLDTISPFMDLSSFRIGNASHDFEVAVEDNRTVKVTFDNIMLPDSNTNEAASHGFFTYYLKQMPDLPEGTQITNSAGIYFDFNDPVITNTTVHTIDYNIVSVPELSSEIGFDINPNPANDFVTIQLKDQLSVPGTYEILNVQGQSITSGSFSDPIFTLGLDSMSKGIYFVRIIDDRGLVGVQKLLVQ